MTEPMPSVAGAGVSRALSIAITMTALTGPVLAGYFRAADGTHDFDPVAIYTILIVPYGVIALALFAAFAPAMTVGVGHARTAREIWLSTAWILVCLASAHVGLAIVDNLTGALFFPVAGVVAMLGALRICESALPRRPLRRGAAP